MSSVAKTGTDIGRNLGKKILEKEMDRFNKEYITSLGITLTNNEIKDITKVIKSLKNRGILLKGTTKKVTSQEGGFYLQLLFSFRLLITAALLLMKSIFTYLMFCYHLYYQQQCQRQMQLFKKIHGWRITALITSSREMEDVMKIGKSLEESGFLIKGISETIKNEAKEQKEEFFSMLLGILAASILENTLAGQWVIKAGESTTRAGKYF